MNLPFARVCTIGVILAACSGVSAQEAHPLSAMLANFDGEVWATVNTERAGYQLRLLTAEQKASVQEQTTKYRQLRSQRGRETSTDVARVIAAYRALPADVRTAEFLRVERRFGNAVELKQYIDTLWNNLKTGTWPNFYFGNQRIT